MDNEDGYVLIMSLVILTMLTVIGISGLTTSTIEIQIAGNDRLHKMAFFAADGGTEGGIELLEQNIEEGGFDNENLGSVQIFYQDAGNNSLRFYTNTDATNPTPSSTNYDVSILGVGQNSVYLRIYGNTSLSTGSALQLASGYEGKGKGVAGGGGYVAYDVRGRSEGPSDSSSTVLHRWRHLL